MIYDAHNHLQDERLAAVRSRLGKTGVARAVVNGTSENDWAAVLELAEEFPFVVPSLGLHPWFVKDRTPGWESGLRELLDQRKCGLGEIGLDRWIAEPGFEEQQEVFAAQLSLAAERNLPVTIHCLKAWGRLDEMLRAGPLPACGFLLHSYGGPAEMVKGFAELGAYFSLSGYFAEPRKARQRRVFRSIPRERLLLETDAPDMPLPAERDRFKMRSPAGEAVNHPGNIHAVYDFAAELLEIPRAELEVRVAENFLRLFGGLTE